MEAAPSSKQKRQVGFAAPEGMDGNHKLDQAKTRLEALKRA